MNKDFAIKPIHPKKGNPLNKAFTAATLGSVLALTSCTQAANDGGVVVVGVVAINFTTKESVINWCDDVFYDEFGTVSTNNTPLTLTSLDGLNEIDFTADGYNSEKKIAYEVIDELYSGDDADTISVEERALLPEGSYKFGDHYILILDMDSDGIMDFELQHAINELITFYNNDTQQ